MYVGKEEVVFPGWRHSEAWGLTWSNSNEQNRTEQNRTEQNRIVVQLEGTYNDHLVQLLHHFRADQK